MADAKEATVYERIGSLMATMIGDKPDNLTAATHRRSIFKSACVSEQESQKPKGMNPAKELEELIRQTARADLSIGIMKLSLKFFFLNFFDMTTDDGDSEDQLAQLVWDSIKVVDANPLTPEQSTSITKSLSGDGTKHIMDGLMALAASAEASPKVAFVNVMHLLMATVLQNEVPLTLLAEDGNTASVSIIRYAAGWTLILAIIDQEYSPGVGNAILTRYSEDESGNKNFHLQMIKQLQGRVRFLLPGWSVAQRRSLPKSLEERGQVREGLEMDMKKPFLKVGDGNYLCLEEIRALFRFGILTEKMSDANKALFAPDCDFLKNVSPHIRRNSETDGDQIGDAMMTLDMACGLGFATGRAFTGHIYQEAFNRMNWQIFGLYENAYDFGTSLRKNMAVFFGGDRAHTSVTITPGGAMTAMGIVYQRPSIQTFLGGELAKSFTCPVKGGLARDMSSQDAFLIIAQAFETRFATETMICMKPDGTLVLGEGSSLSMLAVRHSIPKEIQQKNHEKFLTFVKKELMLLCADNERRWKEGEVSKIFDKFGEEHGFVVFKSGNAGINRTKMITGRGMKVLITKGMLEEFTCLNPEDLDDGVLTEVKVLPGLLDSKPIRGFTLEQYKKWAEDAGQSTVEVIPGREAGGSMGFASRPTPFIGTFVPPVSRKTEVKTAAQLKNKASSKPGGGGKGGFSISEGQKKKMAAFQIAIAKKAEDENVTYDGYFASIEKFMVRSAGTGWEYQDGQMALMSGKNWAWANGDAAKAEPNEKSRKALVDNKRMVYAAGKAVEIVPTTDTKWEELTFADFVEAS